MGNLSFIVPTRNQIKFNIDDVYDLLYYRFPELKMTKSGLGIRVEYKNRLVTILYFNQECYVINFDRDIQELKNRGKKDMADKLSDLKKLNPDLHNCIQATYGVGIYLDQKNDIEMYLKDYFHAYIFDEGIHPEFITPDYKRKKLSFIKRFGNFLS